MELCMAACATHTEPETEDPKTETDSETETPKKEVYQVHTGQSVRLVKEL